MKRAEIVVFGGEPKLIDQIQDLAQPSSSWVRPVRHAKTCLNLLRLGAPGLLVAKLGANLEQEVTLLADIARLLPGTRVIVVGNSDHPTLAGLCWDLGAHYVLFPPEPLERLREVLPGFMP